MQRSRVTVDQAVARLRQQFEEQGLGPQQRVEPERVLAQMLGCSRQTIRAALDRLEKEGLIWRHVGQGTFMGPRPKNKFIRPLVLSEMASPADLMAARLVIEPPVAAAAASAATAEDLALLRELALKSRDAPSWHEYELVDDAFHKAIAGATGNHLLMAVLGMLSSVRGRSRWQRQHDAIFRYARQREYALEQGYMHLAIVDAIAAGDAGAAHEAMLRHLNSIQGLVGASGRVGVT